MFKNPFVIKTLAILAIIGLLMLALGQIGHLTSERQGRFAEAVQGIERAQSGRQALVGPVLQAVCKEEWETVTGTGPTSTKVANKRDFKIAVTPQELKIQTQVLMEPRYRGLFKVNTYAAKMSLQAQWPAQPGVKREQAGSRLSCEPMVMMVAVSDGRGIRHAQIQLDGKPAEVLPGTQNDKFASGFHTVLSGSGEMGAKPLSAAVTLELVGTTDLAVTPIGDDTQMQISANWPHPSFGGRFLPVTRDISDTGFTAQWRISSLATTAAHDFFRGAALCAGTSDDGSSGMHYASSSEASAATAPCMDTFGVAFIDPVNPYSLSDRAVKYGLLFIVLSFVAVALVEVLRSLRVHPVQYLLVGLALSMFFLLLLSLSEHLSFALSYLIASGACVALLSFYASHLLGGWKPGLCFGAAVAALYGGLYMVLQMEQTALVVGAVLLFAVLAAVMTLTRRVDWYKMMQPDAAARSTVTERQT